MHSSTPAAGQANAAAECRSRWVTFDCFGTLVDWNSGFRTILTELFGERTDKVIQAYHKCESVVEARKPHLLYREVLGTALHMSASSIGLTLEREQTQVLPKRWGELAVFSDVENLLAELRRLGCRLAVLTNCDEDLFAVTHQKFRKPFDLVVTSERVREYKPAHGHFRAFREMTGVRPAEWIHVACSWFHDIAPARDFGIRSVWLDRDRTGNDPSAASVRIETADQLGEEIRRLFCA